MQKKCRDESFLKISAYFVCNMVNSGLRYLALLFVKLFFISCLSAQENENYALVLKDSLIAARHKESLPILIFQPKKWKVSIDDNPAFANPFKK